MDAAEPPLSFPSTERYRYVRTLGRGGMGEVFEAFDREYGHPVALKTLRGHHGGSIDAIVNEFRAQRVSHPNLIRPLDLFAEDEQVYFTMELLDAVDLARWAWVDDPINVMSTLGLEETARDAHVIDPSPGSGRGPVLSLERIRALARICCDLVSALHTLHRAGLVHRDVKPSNILVTEGDRAVLADFGLAATYRPAPGEPPPTIAIAGTPGYMAPELLDDAPSPASDFFSLGATIFHALTGGPPRLDAEIDVELPPVCHDPRLAELVIELLDPDPDVRPAAVEIFSRLAAVADEPGLRLPETVTSRSHPLAGPAASASFVGRERELEQLDRALARAAGLDVATVVSVRGPSGVGKTALINHWLERAGRQVELLVLRGQCHLHERVAFAGFDHAIVNLRDFLVANPELREAHEARISVVGAMFPRLRPLGDPTSAAASLIRALGEKDRRHESLARLRELLEALGRARRLVIWIDDVQWLDGDSASLLEHLLSGGGAAGMLVVLSSRDELGRGLVAEAAHPPAQLELELGGLTAREVAAVAGGHTGVDEARLHELTGGLPIFARMLAGGGQPDAGEGDPLGRVIRRTIAGLDAQARRLLSTIALAPGSLPRELAIEAAAIDTAALALQILEQASLIRPVPGAESRRVVVFHDRVRQAHRDGLDEAEARATHAQLADAYAHRSPEAHESLAYHLLEAGRPRAAARHVLAAAERAEDALAFATAGDYYELALELLPERGQLWARLADARANEGRSEVAAEAYERAARLAEHNDRARAHRLLDRAASEYLHCGRVNHGCALVSELLAAHGLSLPGSLRAGVLRSLGLRARLVLGGRARLHDARSPDPETLEQLEILWTAATGLAHINFALADVLLLAHLRLALRSGARGHAFRSLSFEAAAESTIGGRVFGSRADRLLDEAWELLQTTPERARDYDLAWYWVSAGTRAFFAGDWPKLVDCAEKAERHFVAHGFGVSWERSVNDLYWLFGLALSGDVERLVVEHRRAFTDARLRGDRLAQNNCRSGYSAMVWLYRGELDRARREVRRCLEPDRWWTDEALSAPWPEGVFRTPDYHNLLAQAHIHLYAGEARQAWRKLDVAWPHVARALLLSMCFVGVDLRYLCGRVALAARVELLREGTPPENDWPARWTARKLEARARAELRRLRRSDEPCAGAYAVALEAGLPGIDERRRAELLQLAAERFEALSMRKHAAAARWWLGEPADCDANVARMLVPWPG